MSTFFDFWRADVLEGALAGTVPPSASPPTSGFSRSRPSTCSSPASWSRARRACHAVPCAPLSGVVAGAYTTSVVAKAVSDTWVHYLVESGVEIALLVVIGWVAWRWRPAHDAAFVGFVS